MYSPLHSRDVKLFQDWGFDYLKCVYAIVFSPLLFSSLGILGMTIAQVNISSDFYNGTDSQASLLSVPFDHITRQGVLGSTYHLGLREYFVYKPSCSFLHSQGINELQTQSQIFLNLPENRPCSCLCVSGEGSVFLALPKDCY